MNEVMINYNEKDLLVFFQQVRLKKAKELADQNVKTAYKNKEGSSFQEKLSNFSRFLQRNIKSSDVIKNHANEALDKFNANHDKVMSKEEAVDLIKRSFENDNYGLAKLLFASSIILDNEYQYEYLEEGLSEASKILYDNEDTLLDIKRDLEENFRSISLTSLTNFEKGALIGAAGIAIILGPLFAIAGATVGVIAAHSLLSKNNERFKEEFKNASSQDNAFYLAIELTYIQRIKNSLKEDEFKEELDSILKHLEEVKGDLDYFLFVEKANTKENKEKMQVLHAFDKRLVKVLGID